VDAERVLESFIVALDLWDRRFRRTTRSGCENVWVAICTWALLDERTELRDAAIPAGIHPWVRG